MSVKEKLQKEKKNQVLRRLGTVVLLCVCFLLGGEILFTQYDKHFPASNTTKEVTPLPPQPPLPVKPAQDAAAEEITKMGFDVQLSPAIKPLPGFPGDFDYAAAVEQINKIVRTGSDGKTLSEKELSELEVSPEREMALLESVLPPEMEGFDSTSLAEPVRVRPDGPLMKVHVHHKVPTEEDRMVGAYPKSSMPEESRKKWKNVRPEGELISDNPAEIERRIRDIRRRRAEGGGVYELPEPPEPGEGPPPEQGMPLNYGTE